MVKASSTDDLYEQLEALPEHLVGEIIDGELVVSPRPALRHALASSSIHYDVYGRFHRGSPGGWWIVFEPELHLGSDVVDPDIAGWRRERLPILPDAAFSTVPPDWVCEILSPSTAFSDRKRKMPIYAREGVPHFWLVDPHLHSLEVYRLQQAQWLLHAVHGGEETVHAPPFEEVAFDLTLWWAPEAEGMPETAPETTLEEPEPSE